MIRGDFLFYLIDKGERLVGRKKLKMKSKEMMINKEMFRNNRGKLG